MERGILRRIILEKLYLTIKEEYSTIRAKGSDKLTTSDYNFYLDEFDSKQRGLVYNNV